MISTNSPAVAGIFPANWPFVVFICRQISSYQVKGTFWGGWHKIGLHFFWSLIILSQVGCKGDEPVDQVNKPTPQKPSFPFYMASSYKEPEDNPSTKEGVELGKALFFEKALSLDNTLSCASCHQPTKGFSNGEKVGTGIKNARGKRNVPGLWNTGFQQSFFWDGRVKSLEEQSLHPIQDPTEMGIQLAEAESRIKSI